MSGDNHTPHADGRWAFDESVTANFDTMLSKSIPQYDSMRELTFNLGRNFASTLCGNIVDVGASRGEALAPFVDAKFYMSDYYALEISEPMLEVLRTRFNGPSQHVVATDLRQLSAASKGMEPQTNSLVLSILTLQFTPIEYRAKILRTIFKSLKSGGAFLFVEKILGATAEIDELLVKEYYEMKQRNGYSYEDIQRKKASLEGILVPTTDAWNREMLRNAGFNQIDCYYRSMNFAGYIAIKD